MNLSERQRKFPIRFYQNADQSVSYESAYFSGTAKDLDQAMKKLMQSQESLIKDLYLYDDVTDVQIGSYEVADRLKTSKGRTYLGQIHVLVDLNDWTGKNTLKHVSKNPQDLKAHKDLVRAIELDNKKRKFVQGVKDFMKRFIPQSEEYKGVPMDITRLYVQRFVNESLEDSAADVAEIANEDASEWQFLAHDPGMSEAATYTYGKPVQLVSTEIIDGGANTLPSDQESAELFIDAEDMDTFFALLYSDEESAFGYHFSIFDYDGSEFMAYNYAHSMEELKAKVENELLPYISGLTMEEIPFDEFQKELDAMHDSDDAEVVEESIDSELDVEEMELEEAAVNEASKTYTFHVDCEASIDVVADSEDLAREILKKNSTLEFYNDQIEFAGGDAVLKALILDEIDHVSEFDPEV